MATEFSIDDAFALEGEEDEVGQEKEREPGDGASLTFGPLSFSKPQGLPSAAVGSSDHSSLKYQNLENEEALGNSGNSSFNNFFKISDPATLSYCSSQWSFSTLSSVTQLSAHCCSWTSHPLVKKNRRVVLASFLLFITGLALIFTGVVIQLNPQAGVSSAIFFVPGFLLFIPGAYHVIYIICAVRGHRGFKFFYLPYFEK
ncbi:transmembrane protein 134-like [Scleropages formosus]|uniref:Transmembrane protein 134 n=1 Tax=Scleropages formosus TaxID=113540 RepID=A0A0P7WYR2_SCLFO|nr:transmembrane protein 134 isoform X2 [Scleropages formosus]KPP69365.1 transmembrane protein 134-like [Scleropages formosus]